MNLQSTAARGLAYGVLRRICCLAGRLYMPVHFCLIALLLACNGGKEESTTSATSTGGETGVCSNSVPVVGGPCAPYGAIATGAYHTCALIAGGNLRCWGRNDRGQLGLGNLERIGDDEVPNAVPPVDLGEAAIQVTAGYAHTCALTESGRVFCWGVGEFGILGHGDTVDIGDDEVPASAGPVPLAANAIQVAAGFFHTCALVGGGSVYCWGVGQSGQLGTGSTENVGDDETPASQDPIDLGGPAVYIASAEDHTCAVLEGGGVICWGLGEYGQLGQGNTENVGDDETPGSVGPIDVGAAVERVATGLGHSCALTVAGEVRCWGSNGDGALGSGNGWVNIGDDETPSAVGAVSLGRLAVAVAAHSSRTCALLDDGTLKCWGGNEFGQLGYGHVDDLGKDSVPSDFGPIDVGGATAQVAVGGNHTCALLTDGSVRCWGEAVHGALGYGNTLEGSPCKADVFDFICDVGAVCCIGDMPGEMPPSPVQYQ